MKRSVLVALCAATGSPTFAEVVQFINTNPMFGGLSSYYFVSFDKDDTFERLAQPLDIRQDAFNQPELSRPPMPSGLLYFDYNEGFTSSQGDVLTLRGASNVRIASYIVNDFEDQVFGISPSGTYDVVKSPQLMAVGDIVDASWNWTGVSPVWGAGYTNDSGNFETFFHLGEAAIVGIELTLDSGVHYGFVEFELVNSASWPPLYAAVRWGWETEAGVALVIPPIPAPGAGVLLAVGGLAATRRRR